jgi:replicative DNA helicase
MNELHPELTLVAGALVRPALAPEAANYVDPEDFEDGRLKMIWTAIMKLIEDGKSEDDIDPMAVGRQCAKSVTVQRKIAMYCGELLDKYPRQVSLVASAQRVHRRATMRSTLERMRAIAVDLKREIDSDDGDIQDLDERLAALSIEVSTRSDTANRRTVHNDYAREITRYLDSIAAGPNTEHIPTGITRLDRKLGGGLRPGQLHSILGGTGSGKTALASQICDEAVSRGFRSLMFSMEVDPVDVYIRDVERAAGRSRWDLRSPFTATREHATEALVEAQSRLMSRETGKVVFGEPMSVEGIRQAILTEQLRGGRVDVVAVDHAQVALPSPHESATMPRYLQVKNVAESLRQIAKRLNVAVVLTAQLNPPPKGERPSKDHVREGKDINNASEVVVIIWHEKEEHEEDVILVNSWLIVDKARAGIEGKVRVRYRGECYRFEDPQDAS